MWCVCSASSDIEVCADGDGDNMRARLKFVGIEQLQRYAGKKMLVDVLGLVTSVGARPDPSAITSRIQEGGHRCTAMCGSDMQVGALGNVKRTRDGTELARRDITLVDERCETCSVQDFPATAP